MSPIKEAIEARSLYEVTGDIKDINTMLINRAELAALRSMPAEPVAERPADIAAKEREACAAIAADLAGFLSGHGDKEGAEICVSIRDAIKARTGEAEIAAMGEYLKTCMSRTTPPPAPVLSDAEIDAITVAQWGDRVVPAAYRAYARAILGRASRGAK